MLLEDMPTPYYFATSLNLPRPILSLPPPCPRFPFNRRRDTDTLVLEQAQLSKMSSPSISISPTIQPLPLLCPNILRNSPPPHPHPLPPSPSPSLQKRKTRLHQTTGKLDIDFSLATPLLPLLLSNVKMKLWLLRSAIKKLPFVGLKGREVSSGRWWRRGSSKDMGERGVVERARIT